MEGQLKELACVPCILRYPQVGSPVLHGPSSTAGLTSWTLELLSPSSSISLVGQAPLQRPPNMLWHHEYQCGLRRKKWRTSGQEVDNNVLLAFRYSHYFWYHHYQVTPKMIIYLRKAANNCKLCHWEQTLKKKKKKGTRIQKQYLKFQGKKINHKHIRQIYLIQSLLHLGQITPLNKMCVLV